jgi:hypothetical protein
LTLAAYLAPTSVAQAAGLSKSQPDAGSAGFSTAPEVSSAADAQALGGLLPDIIEETPKHLGIQNAGQREVLRFSTTHWNFGDGPLQIHGGGQVAPCVIDGVSYDQCTFATQEFLNSAGEVVAAHPAGVALFHPEHKHWHISSVAMFTLRRTPDGPPVAGVTLKTTFCLVDFDKSDIVAQGSDRAYWECNAALQGISVGWGDEYHHSTPGQEVDITGLPAGDYYLTHDADPSNHWLESDDTNNQSWVRFRFTRKGANPELTVLESSGYEGNSANK